MFLNLERLRLVNSGKLSVDELINVGNEGQYDSSVWEAIVSQLHLDQLSAEQLLKIGNKAVNTHVWLGIISTCKLSIDQMLNVWKCASDRDVWVAIIRQLHLGQLTTKQLLEIGNKAQSSYLWQKIIEQLYRNQLPVDQLEAFDEAYAHDVWEAIAIKFSKL